MPGLEQAPPILAVLAAAVLYELGRRRRIRPVSGRTLHRRRLQAACFAGALAVTLVALASPLDAAVDEGFWPHMLQHVLLMTVVAPLLVVAEPWSMLWRPLPLVLRRRLAGGVARGRATAPLRAAARPLGRPLPALVVFTAALWLWHIPWAYEQALRHQAVHDLEHLTLLASSVLLWEQAIDTAPLRPRLNAMERALYLTAAAAVGWLLSVVLAFWPT